MGSSSRIVSDNEPPFIKALEYLRQKYHINHIHISGYNLHANGIVEQSHFDVQQALYKVVNGVQVQYFKAVYLVFLADCITVHHHMGCLPYFAATGTHLLIPLDIVEATYLLPPPDLLLSTMDLIASCVIMLQKHHFIHK